MPDLIAKHGGYKSLKSFQNAEIVCDFTVEFCKHYLSRTSRTVDQMEQAARSGKQNIAEGAQASGISKQTELKLIGVARASLEELLLDYEDFLRQRGLRLWGRDEPPALEIRKLAYGTNRTYRTYRAYMSDAEVAANCAIALIHQTNYLLDRQLQALESELKAKGDFNERLKAHKKEALLGSKVDFDDFLREQGLRRLENGRVVKLGEPDS